MYLGVGVVFLLALTLMSPVIWIAAWLIADAGARARRGHVETAGTSTEQWRHRAA